MLCLDDLTSDNWKADVFMVDVVALGELLIDFTPAPSEYGSVAYVRNAGGAPANVLAMLSRLGKKTAFIGKVGQDSFGTFLKQTLVDYGIQISNLIESRQSPTALAFVQLDEAGNRFFEFYRKHSADIMLRKEDISVQLLSECRIFHFGSVSMTDTPARDATIYAACEAKKLGKLVSYDPNFRAALWPDRDEAIQVMRSGLEYADIVKVSDDEIALLTDTEDLLRGAEVLVKGGAKLALVTAGAKGCWYISAYGHSGHVPSFSVQTVDTTGAGDTFLGAFLSQLLNWAQPLERITDAELNATIRFANAAGALCATGFGAVPSMPTEAQIKKILELN